MWHCNVLLSIYNLPINMTIKLGYNPNGGVWWNCSSGGYLSITFISLINKDLVGFANFASPFKSRE